MLTMATIVQQIAGKIALFAILCGCACAQPAETIYHNGKIVTMWPEHPTAQAVAIRGDRFLVVGTDAEVLKTAGPRTKRVDLRGGTVVPGLIESHVHPLDAALSEIDGPIPLF